ncbi:MAG: hypothetical protein ACTSW4_00995 [Candidatus Ranarchaeia archaeon]
MRRNDNVDCSLSLRDQVKMVRRHMPLISVISTLFVIMIVLVGDVSPPNLVGVRGIFPASSVQMLAGIWFGVWGLPAGFAGGFVYHVLHGQTIPVACLISLGDIWTGLIPAIIFRYLHLNYSLSSTRDWVIYLLGVILMTPIPSAMLGLTVLILSNTISWTSFWLGFGYWIAGAYFTNSLVVSLALPLLSPLMEKKGLITRQLIV